MPDDTKKLSVSGILRASNEYTQKHWRWLLCFWFVNFLFMYFFHLIPNGFSNPMSMLWLLFYYIYWCAFFRVYYQKKPYLVTGSIFKSMVPSTKIFFIMLMAALLLTILPYVPLLMGFNDKYLIFFENYMEALQNSKLTALNRLAFSIVLIIFSPMILCRPFFAWISSLQGLNGSLRKAFRRTKGNYKDFLVMMSILNLPVFLIYELELLLDYPSWFFEIFCSFFFIYFNIVFAKMYDFFYSE